MKTLLRRSYLLLPLLLAGLTILAACSGYVTTSSTTSTTSTGNSVTISNYSFSPATLTVTAGTTVTWTNKDSVAHTVTSDGSVFSSGDLSPNASFKYTFKTAGTFTYHCAIHVSMKGTVIVK